MLGPLSLSLALLLCPMEPHTCAQVRVEPDRGRTSEWAACWYFAALVRSRAYDPTKDCPFIRSRPSPENWLRDNLRTVYVAPGLLEISLPSRDDPGGAAAAVNAVADKSIPAALAYWKSGLEKTTETLRFEIKDHRRQAEEWRRRAEQTPAEREAYLQIAARYLNAIPQYEVQLDRMERSLAQGLPRVTVIHRAKP